MGGVEVKSGYILRELSDLQNNLAKLKGKENYYRLRIIEIGR